MKKTTSVKPTIRNNYQVQIKYLLAYVFANMATEKI